MSQATFPKRKDRFVQWAKEMVEGATIDRPRLTRKQNGGKMHPRTTKRHRGSTRRKRKNAKTE